MFLTYSGNKNINDCFFDLFFEMLPSIIIPTPRKQGCHLYLGNI